MHFTYVNPEGHEITLDASSIYNGYINIRGDGRIERVCIHGVGHPIGHLHQWESWMGIHGCCGCCKEYPKA